jgi:hypothetical protein
MRGKTWLFKFNPVKQVTFYILRKSLLLVINVLEMHYIPKLLNTVKSSVLVLSQETIHHFESGDMENTEIIITQLSGFFTEVRGAVSNSVPIIIATLSCGFLRYPVHRYHAVPSPGFGPTTLWL